MDVEKGYTSMKKEFGEGYSEDGDDARVFPRDTEEVCAHVIRCEG